MNPRRRWAIALLMAATIFRVQTLTLIPDLEMYDGAIPDAWFAPLVSDAIIGLLVPLMVFLFIALGLSFRTDVMAHFTASRTDGAEFPVTP